MLIIIANNGEPLSWLILYAACFAKECQTATTMEDNVGVICHVTINSD